MKFICSRRHLLVMGCSLAAIGYVFSIATASLGLMAFLLIWLLNIKNLNFSNFLNNKSLWIPAGFYLIMLMSLLYSLDYSQGVKIVIRYLSFVLLPIIFLTIKGFSDKERSLILKIFVFAVTFFHLSCFLNAIYRQVVFFWNGGVFNWYFFFRYDLLEIFEQHPTYVAMFTLMSISILLFSSLKQLLSKKYSFFLLLVQFVGLLFSGSRIGLLILIVIISLYVYRKVFVQLQKTNSKRISIILVSTFLMLFIVWNIPVIKERILFTIGYDYDYKFNKKKFVKNGAPEKHGRLLLWGDVIELIKEKPIFGYGTGSNNIVLNKKYEEKGHRHFLNENYNAHNTYLELLISGGFFHLSIFLLMLLSIVFKGWRKKDFVTLSFFCVISITALTETIFRSQGIIFFTFFYCFLLSKPKIKREGVLLVGPYPPPIGGISLFIKKLNSFLSSTFNEEVNIVNEFGNNTENSSVYNLSSSSKLLYFFRLLYYLFFLNTNKYVFYHGVHGITRFILVFLSKILNYEVVFQFHGKSVVQFHEKNKLTNKISSFSLKGARKLIAVNNDIINELKVYIPSLEVSNIPAYLPDHKMILNPDVDGFFKGLDNRKKYFLSYATLDKANNGEYNYGINDLFDFFDKNKIRDNGCCLILVLILYKKEHVKEYEEKLSVLFKRENSNVEVFINHGNTPLVPFFRYVEGYIRWTYEDGLGVSLIEALDYGISAIATNVCERPKGVKTFDIINPIELEKYVLLSSNKKVIHRRIDYQKEYINLFTDFGFTFI
ncbi:O-antigen ligase family protein [Algibacter sp. TI.3.09]|uniref:O-antigen ligase family protein n=1 Tax=Algibacter sp. TI.3.09 TaxID=3121298 RepID=UPI00311DCB27